MTLAAIPAPVLEPRLTVTALPALIGDRFTAFWLDLVARPAVISPGHILAGHIAWRLIHRFALASWLNTPGWWATALIGERSAPTAVFTGLAFPGVTLTIGPGPG